jgi:enoyl-CoA hydratase/carnithine racemase
MGYQIVKFEEEDRVAIIELIASIGDPDRLTLLSEEISECCQRFRMNDENLVLVIREAAAGFFAIEKEVGSIGRGCAGCVSLSQSIAECERPVLAGILGDAVGPGLELVLACDIRVVSETARFGLPQIGAGLIPWDGGTQRLSRTVGKGRTLEMILTGRLLDAEEANRVGLVHRIVPTEEVIPTVMGLARDMASKSPVSLEYCKEAIIRGMDLRLEQGFRAEADLYFLMHTTRDREEGIRAFKETRKAEFKGT